MPTIENFVYWSSFWKDLENHDKGTIKVFYKQELKDFAQIKSDEMPLVTKTQKGRGQFSRYNYCTSRMEYTAKKWLAIYSDEVQYPFKASSSATRPIMASIVSRWGNPPAKLKFENRPAFSVNDLKTDKSSCVYFVQLLTFYPTQDGKAYYKIGKAKSIPNRIQQFGPCRLVDSIRLPTEEASYEVESTLHKKFESYRRPDTEIFYLSLDELQLVRTAFKELTEQK